MSDFPDFLQYVKQLCILKIFHIWISMGFSEYIRVYFDIFLKLEVFFSVQFCV
jgi:hypothetical protein